MHLTTASPEKKSGHHFETFVIPNRAESPVRNLLFSRSHHDPRVPHPSRTLRRSLP